MNDDLFTGWANQLQDYQRNYQDAWRALTSHALHPSLGGSSSGMDMDGANPWIAALEQWWKIVQADTTPGVQDFYARLVEQGKIYIQMTDGLDKAFQQPVGDSAAPWQETVNNTLAGLTAIFDSHTADVQGGARQAIAFWGLPLDMWRRAVSSSALVPGDFLQHVRTLGVGGQVRDVLRGRVDQLLSTPAIGYMREEQEQTQTLIKLNIEYQHALQDYAATYSEIGVKCIEALQAKLQERTTEDKPVDSLRELYELWVDSCEQAYAEYVSTDKYAETYGRLINKLMALKRHGTMMADEVLGAMNMPTRIEIDTLQLRLQEVRREGKAVRAEIESLKCMRQAGAEEQEVPAPPPVTKPKQAAARRKAAAAKSTSKDSVSKPSRRAK
jgi:class III poly(R)-hydroxyalkanoic acid synthase PhaE subunit